MESKTQEVIKRLDSIEKEIKWLNSNNLITDYHEDADMVVIKQYDKAGEVVQITSTVLNKEIGK